MPTERLRAYLQARGLDAEIVRPGGDTSTVTTSAQALGVAEDQIFKSLLFQGRDGALVLVVASGTRKVSASKLAAVTGLRKLKLAPPEVVHNVTGYPAGGTPPIGHAEQLRVVVDRSILAFPFGYGGGGSAEVVLRVSPETIIRENEAEIADVTDF